MNIEIVQIDAFTATPFAGNPAAVCLLDTPRPDAWIQDVAREMNLSETAFLLRRADDDFDLRWFTPKVEVDLCGHATLASAHFLWEGRHLSEDAEARFHTRSGLLTARRQGDWILMDFPATPPAAASPPDGLLPALGVKAVTTARSAFDWLVKVATEDDVRDLRPDFKAPAAFPVRGVIVTAAGTTPGFDFISRFFAPGAGIDEDPVTGSAHCALGPFWAGRLGRSKLLAYQASPRGGVVGVEVAGDRVLLRGQAVTVLRATLTGDAATA